MAGSALTGALLNRRSARAFADRLVEQEKIQALIEAFRWAPSSQNRQPWRLLIARSEEARARWDASLTAGNQAWAPRAPLKLVVIGNPEEQQDQNGQQRYLIDCGLALNALLVQACAMDLNVRAMAGWDEDKVRTGFDVPDPFRVVALVAVGYPGRVEDLPIEIQQKEARARVRKPSAEIACYDRFTMAGVSGR